MTTVIDPDGRLDHQVGREHLARVRLALDELDPVLPQVARWAELLSVCLGAGGRVLALGNGGSAAQAEHFTAELVGRYQAERPPFSAIALTADTAALTALGNDYGVSEQFARQVEAHGRAGDMVLALSTSGRSPNVLRAVADARTLGLTTLALTGAAPNELASLADDAIPVASDDTATVQEIHQILIHLVCEAFDALVAERDPTSDRTTGRARP